MRIVAALAVGFYLGYKAHKVVMASDQIFKDFEAGIYHARQYLPRDVIYTPTNQN